VVRQRRRRRAPPPLRALARPAHASPRPGAARARRYSFSQGPVHFLQLSTEEPFGAGSVQWVRAAKGLRATRRGSLTPPCRARH